MKLPDSLEQALKGFPDLPHRDDAARPWNPKPYPPRRIGIGSPDALPIHAAKDERKLHTRLAADLRDTAGDELDAKARQRMASHPGETYQTALHAVMAADPVLRDIYVKGDKA